MVSDEERREIAKAIRDRIWRNERSSWDVVFELSCIDVLGRCLSRNKDAALLLADLIDRPTCRNIGDDYMFKCSECGAEFEPVTVNGNEYGEVFYTPLEPLYCSACGAVVVE